MRSVIEKLLILQDRDRKILRLKEELSRVEPERQMLVAKAAQAQAGLDHAKADQKQIESDRKKLELEVEAKKQLIERYSLQQFQTKKNEEYRALAHEIETCKAAIVTLEDQEIELMEKAEKAQAQSVAAQREADEAKRISDAQLKELLAREQNLKKELAALESDRDQLAAGVEPAVLAKYQRLLKQKGENVVVGINHGVCGGCHMRFPVQLVVMCQAQQELVSCPNCSRILYFSPDMDLAVMD